MQGFLSKRTFFTIVNHGYEAQRTLLGRNPKKLEPGIRLAVPWFHQVKKISMMETSVILRDLYACTSDNVRVVVDATLFFQVNDSYKACFNVQDYKNAVFSVGTSVTRTIIGAREYDNIIKNRSEINMALTKSIGDSLVPWGLQSTKVEIQGFDPASSSVEKSLELQMEAERRRREKELDTKAQINIADGQRQAEILRSEGERTAIVNKAEAEYHKNVREADALCAQLRLVTAEMGGDVNQAALFILNQRRLNELTALASGTNRVYFMNSKDRETVADNVLNQEGMIFNK